MRNADTVNWRVGCAGWNLPAEMRVEDAGTYLEQYARLFPCVEINSSFYRHHQEKTYLRWASVVPDSFRFSVKFPKSVTHTEDPFAETVTRFLQEAEGLGEKLEILLLQFPPKREFDDHFAAGLLAAIRRSFKGRIVCEPRHPSWFRDAPKKSLKSYLAEIVVADPPPVADAPNPLDAPSGSYLRLHGAPRMYSSAYTKAFIDGLLEAPLANSRDTWVIFDNTATGNAFRDAARLLRDRSSARLPPSSAHS